MESILMDLFGLNRLSVIDGFDPVGIDKPGQDYRE